MSLQHKNLFEVKLILLFVGIGRLLFGKLSDIPFISRNGNRIVLQQVWKMS